MVIKEVDDSFRRVMEHERIDIDLTLSILKNFNDGKCDSLEKAFGWTLCP